MTAMADPINDALLQYGAVGLLALAALIVARVLWRRETESYEREKQRADRLEAELLKLNTAIQERYLIALQDATKAVADAMSRLRR